MFNAMTELERQLRQTADRARRDAPRLLRQRTLDALRDAPPAPAARVRFPAQVPAAFALAASIMVTALIVMMVQERSFRPVHKPVPPERGFVLELPSLDELPDRAKAAHLPLASPLVREARLLARDAERTFDLLQRQLDRLPRRHDPEPARSKAES
jgi:hypothetical protein